MEGFADKANLEPALGYFSKVAVSCTSDPD
jgi:hypothetical protein